MPRFFVTPDAFGSGTVTLTGDDARHISRSLRMAAGERVTVCDGEGYDYDCRLSYFAPDGNTVSAEVLSKAPSSAEPPSKIILWQALPKGEKLDFIIQKAVECGVSEIRLFASERCIAKTDAQSEARKNERRNKIALEAAKQCGRGKIPAVYPTVTFAQMLKSANAVELPLFCYEADGTVPLGKLLDTGKIPESISVVVGSEGGFSEAEADAAKAAGFKLCGLGPRILRTETAPVFVLSAIAGRYELS